MKNIINHLGVVLLGVSLSFSTVAQNLQKDSWSTPWSVTASMGVSTMPYMEGTQGQTALGRLAFDYNFMPNLAVELGVQSGNHMRFSLPHEEVMNFGGVPIAGTLKPSLDVLIGAITPNLSNSIPISGLAKVGIASRQLEMDSESLNDLFKMAPEIQVGLSYSINSSLELQLLYQYIIGKNPEITLDALTEIGHVTNIPAQSGVLLGLKINLG